MTQRKRQRWRETGLGFLHHSLKFLVAGKHDSPDSISVSLVGLPLVGLPLGPQARSLLPIFHLETDTTRISYFCSLPASSACKEKPSPALLQDSQLLPRG